MRIVLVLVVGLLISGCSGSDDRQVLLVSAAASLTDAFGAVEEAFEAARPDVDVVLNLAGSSSLREQILGGAPADVFASANMENMEQVLTAGLVAGEPRVFARNQLQIAVPPGNPAGISGLADFADESLFLGLCATGVPCGDLARAALASAGVDPAVDTNEPDVRSLLTKIEAGELDAGITYMTDVFSSEGKVEGIDIPDDVNVDASYPIAVLSGAPRPEIADEFVGFLLSAEGQEIMSGFGFSSP
ncbi:MAG: molybdate ABC transporter substrate-binding protein [Actinomycetota bacterium]